VAGADTISLEANGTSPRPLGGTSPRGLDVVEPGRVNGGVCEPLGGSSVKMANDEDGDQELMRRQTGHRDVIEGELPASAAIDLRMYGTTPATRNNVRLYAVS